jgi:hypothetical protein
MSVRAHHTLTVFDTTEFKNSSRHFILCVNSEDDSVKDCLSKIKRGDIIWVANEDKGMIAVCTYLETQKRVTGPIVAITMTNEELGLDEANNSDTEIHYTSLFVLKEGAFVSDVSESPERDYGYIERLLTPGHNPSFKIVDAPEASMRIGDYTMYPHSQVTGHRYDADASILPFDCDRAALEVAARRGYKTVTRVMGTEKTTYYFKNPKRTTWALTISNDVGTQRYRYITWATDDIKVIKPTHNL